ncbi:coiled-coil domain-containing protein [Histomonas meleagridis]|uniref:coiled-coil domain-containing protein 25 n=1 Tax=Histomonas meleagridis TaxID=135588 RepID=UPI00355A61B6|nr:coiled-coil domain-containing protein [Histomonas meleagridis]KAH0797532.1 coiled-coil domain-containing protein 25 [Histomonas meleagridis]
MEETGITLIWHHADKYSSPHAYVRLNPGETVVPKSLANICCQICKDGSIEGVKHPAIDVVYTPASNLMKTKTMNPGQVSFHDRKKIGVYRGVRKDAAILKSLEKIYSEASMSDLEIELQDIVANKKNKSKSKKQKEDWDDFDDDWGDAPAKPHTQNKKKSGHIDMFGDIPKAEFNPNMEDDFM